MSEVTEIQFAPSAPIIDKQHNIYHAGPVGWEALFERVMIVEDKFRSGYECDSCSQTGKITCPDCRDGKSAVNPLIQCKTCHGTMKVTCSECDGNGALLVIPQASERRPTTGVIVSVGQDVKSLRLGETVCYPNFVGETFDLKGVGPNGEEVEVALRIMKEREVICRVTGHLELKRVKRHVTQQSG